MNPWGNERAALLHQGVRLRPRGTAQDEVLREMVRRERKEKLAFARLMVACARGLPGVSSERIDAMLQAYVYEVLQIPAPVKKKDIQEKEHKNLLAKVDRMTVPDAELPKLPEPRGKRGGKKQRR